jgi:hypothetical protein
MAERYGSLRDEVYTYRYVAFTSPYGENANRDGGHGAVRIHKDSETGLPELTLLTTERLYVCRETQTVPRNENLGR